MPPLFLFLLFRRRKERRGENPNRVQNPVRVKGGQRNKKNQQLLTP
jgi:hypothetical protein